MSLINAIENAVSDLDLVSEVQVTFDFETKELQIDARTTGGFRSFREGKWNETRMWRINITESGLETEDAP